jgi:hemolysin activation/secretion protein
LSAARSESTVVEEPLNELGIESELTSYEVAIAQPLYTTLKRTFTRGLALNRRHSETFLLGRPFSFSPGEQDGKSTVTALRFSQTWLDHSLNQVITARSNFSLGVDAFGATINSGSVSDGQYLACLGQFEW